MAPILLTGGPWASLEPRTGDKGPNLWNEPRAEPEIR